MKILISEDVGDHPTLCRDCSFLELDSSCSLFRQFLKYRKKGSTHPLKLPQCLKAARSYQAYRDVLGDV